MCQDTATLASAESDFGKFIRGLLFRGNPVAGLANAPTPASELTDGNANWNGITGSSLESAPENEQNPEG